MPKYQMMIKIHDIRSFIMPYFQQHINKRSILCTYILDYFFPTKIFLFIE